MAKHTLPQPWVEIENLNPYLKTIMKAPIKIQRKKYNKTIKSINHMHHLFTQTPIPYIQTSQKTKNTPKREDMHHKNNKNNKKTVNHTPNTCKTKIKITTQTKIKTPNYTFYNKTTLLKCGDIESNPRPRNTLLLNHPQIHQERQKTYFYNKTTQIKPEYNHIFDLYEPYLNHTQTTNMNQHLTQFCINHNHCPKSYLFYAILITLAPTPTQSNQLIT
jgi:hypothetical protein